MTLVGYLRVSSTGQVTDGHGLQIQEQAIRRWCRDHGHRLIGMCRDEGVTGTTETREGLEEAIAAVKFDGVEGIVVSSLDRLARSLTVQEAALQAVWGADGRVFTVESGEVLADDPEDPVRTFTRQVIGAVGQLEAGLIARRLRHGRQLKAREGGYAHGRPRYGWRAEEGNLVPERDEQEVIELMARKRAEGSSLRDIAGHLNEQGVAAKGGGPWHPQTVARVLSHRED